MLPNNDSSTVGRLLYNVLILFRLTPTIPFNALQCFNSLAQCNVLLAKREMYFKNTVYVAKYRP